MGHLLVVQPGSTQPLGVFDQACPIDWFGDWLDYWARTRSMSSMWLWVASRIEDRRSRMVSALVV